MPNFIPLETFKSFYKHASDLFSDEGFIAFTSILKLEGEKIALENGFSETDFNYFQVGLKSSKEVLFYSWVNQNKTLSNALCRVDFQKLEELNSINNHQLFNQFKSFVTPFLAEILLSRIKKENSLNLIAASYLLLLDEDTRPLIESKLFEPISKSLIELKPKMESSQDEAHLISLIQPLCTAEILGVINGFSKASYAIKLNYVDSILLAVESEACTTRVANWVFKQLSQLNLNKEHHEKIKELRYELSEGKFSVKNQGKRLTKINWKRIVLGTSAGAIIFFIGLLIFLKPFGETINEAGERSSSFKKFTKEERIEIDSLIQTMNNGFELSVDEIDQGVPINNSIAVQIRKAHKNSVMERVYKDLILDADLHTKGLIDSCGNRTKTMNRYGNIGDLLKRADGLQSYFKNDSEYDVLFYVSENKLNGKVFSVYLPKGSKVDLRIKDGDVITAVCGLNNGKYIKPNGIAASETPSKQFNYHFCVVDENYETSINTSYTFKSNHSMKPKFLFVGSSATYFQIVDPQQLLSPY